MGGPLDGQEATRTGTAWSQFRTAEGGYLDSGRGNHVMASEGGTFGRRDGYVLDRERGILVYRWMPDLWD